MRVHGEKVLRRREGAANLRQYSDAREILEEDFQCTCGYCGKNGKVMREKFHIDHFVPKKIDESRINDYYNLVLACPKCNLTKSDKWPTGDKNKAQDGEKGFVDPATPEYDTHMMRNENGFVVGITPVGQSMCRMLHLDLRRTDIYWKVDLLRGKLEKLGQLYKKGELTADQKDIYIEMSMLLNQYLDDAFKLGE